MDDGVFCQGDCGEFARGEGNYSTEATISIIPTKGRLSIKGEINQGAAVI